MHLALNKSPANKDPHNTFYLAGNWKAAAAEWSTLASEELRSLEQNVA